MTQPRDFSFQQIQMAAQRADFGGEVSRPDERPDRQHHHQPDNRQAAGRTGSGRVRFCAVPLSRRKLALPRACGRPARSRFHFGTRLAPSSENARPQRRPALV